MMFRKSLLFGSTINSMHTRTQPLIGMIDCISLWKKLFWNDREWYVGMDMEGTTSDPLKVMARHSFN
jgi:hypothetical protein